MSGWYKISLFVWPYFGITREPSKSATEEERATRGAREPTLTLHAESFEAAVHYANTVLVGVRLDERVYECGILSCEYLGEVRP